MSDNREMEKSTSGLRVLRALAQSTFGMAVLGSLLVWLAQPPMQLGWLAWLAPAPWLVLVLRQDRPGPIAFAKIWLGGVLYWLVAVYWVALAHPLTPIGLGFLAAYLGCYLPVFIGLSRIGVHRLKVPLYVVAPVVWTGLEWLQAHLFSGFLMGALSHTQAFYPRVIQIAEWLGAYGVSFVLMMFAAGVSHGAARLIRSRDPRSIEIDNRPPVGFFVAGLCLAVTHFVGHFSFQAAQSRYSPDRMAKVALIQGDVRVNHSAAPNAREVTDRHRDLSLKAIEQVDKQGGTLDLMVWPESMFLYPVVTTSGEISTPEGQELVALAELRQIVLQTRTPLLVGLARFDYPDGIPDSNEAASAAPVGYNSALLVDSSGTPIAIYDKMHRVPFGEYIPLCEDWDALAYLTPMPGGVKAGKEPVAAPIDAKAGRLIASPSICYETVIPHVIRNQVKTLSDSGTPPDLMVNVTNNAWFWGSSELEMHLACNVFRAVENRTPMVVAANGGLSAAIDSRGRVIEVSNRMTDQMILADVPLDPRRSFYTRYGDVLAGPCLIVCGLLAIIGFLTRERRKGIASDVQASGSAATS